MRTAVSRLAYQAVVAARGENIKRKLAELEESQWWPEEKLAEVQMRKLSVLLEHAYRFVPEQRRRFDEAGLTPSDIQSPSDLTKLPIMTKDSIRKDWEGFRSTNQLERFTGDHTSGSTGHPLRYIKSRSSLAIFRAAQLRGFAWYGVSQGDPSIRFMGTRVDSGGRVKERVKDWIQNRRRMYAYDLTTERMERALKEFMAFNPRFMYGYPSLLYPLAHHLSETRPGQNAFPELRLVVSTSECLFPHRRKAIEEAFRCPVANEYGAMELGIIGFECPEGGLHISSDLFIVESLRGEKSSPDGKAGEIVVTDLTNLAMPFIRYKLGDIGYPTRERCKCGRTLPLLKDLEGAVFGILRTPDGEIVSGIVLYYLAEELILKHRSAMTQLRFVQKDLESLDVLVARGAEFNDSVLVEVEGRLREYLGQKIRFNYEVVDEIPKLLSGKLRLLDSHVPLWSDKLD